MTLFSQPARLCARLIHKERTMQITSSFAVSRPVDASLSSSERAVVEALCAFVSAGDARNVRAVEAILDDGFRVLFTVKGSGEVKTLESAAYLSLLGAGKLGGVTREVKVMTVAVDGALARASAILQNGSTRFEGSYTFAQ